MVRSLLAGITMLLFPAAAMADCPPLKLPPAGARRAAIVAATMPAVVQVLARVGAEQSESYEEVLGDAIRQTQASAKQSHGSGFIVSGEGLVITNEHVVSQATQISVKLADGSVRGARLIGSDERTDIAVLQIEALARCYPALTWGDSDRLAAGEDVTAVGSPFGLGGSVSAGIISGRGRSVGNSQFQDFLQIDAAINQGNSGGPLLDGSGRVIGINTAILSPAGGNIGIGFSLPAAVAQRVMANLLAHGKITRTELGLGVQGLSGDAAEALGLPNNQGVLVTDVMLAAPAQRAGVAAGDVILAVDGRPLTSMSALSAEVASFDAGRAVQLTLWREGRRLAIELIPEAKPDAAQRARQLTEAATPGSLIAIAGLQLAGTTKALNEVAGQRGVVGGLIVVAVAPNSPAEARGIAVGDIITGLVGQPLSSTVQFTDAVAEARASGRRNILVTVQHGRNSVWMALPLNVGE
jgi:serine protease Do